MSGPGGSIARERQPSPEGVIASAANPIIPAKVRAPPQQSMPVERLDGLLDGIWSHRLGMIVAPAGAGKTTLLARLAGRARVPVGWYRAEAWDHEVRTVLRHLNAALVDIVPPSPPWQSVEQAVWSLESLGERRALLVIDDLHVLEGTPAEQAIERFIDYAPSALSVAIASRAQPGFNLSRWRISGQLLELGPDELRFRSWEVERLFRHHYREPLAPEDLAWLARRTGGWVAGLQLFHLATRGRPQEDRHRVLAGLGSSSRLMRDYLMRNVVNQLSAELRRFLLETSVLGRLSGPLCDRLLRRTGSAALLEELDRRSLLMQSSPDEASYRYHEVLRSHLHAILLEELGPIRMRERFRHAAELLAEAGSLAEALEAYCRGDDWAMARHVARQMGEGAAEGPGSWLDMLPQSLLLHDPWLLLASARRLRGAGRLREAVERYQRTERAFGSAEGAQLCRDERNALLVWLDGIPGSIGGWASTLRVALNRDPSGAALKAHDLGGVEGRITEGLALLLAGRAADARTNLLAAAALPEAAALPATIASLAAGVAALLMGLARGRMEVTGAVAAAERLDAEWLARLGRASLAILGTEAEIREAEAVADASGALGDRWGRALAKLFSGWGRVTNGVDPGVARLTSTEIANLGAPVLLAWAHGLDALLLVRAQHPAAAAEAAARADAAADASGAAVARLLSSVALAEAGGEDSDQSRQLAEELAEQTGISVPRWQPPIGPSVGGSETRSAHATARGYVRLLGAFEVHVAGRRLDLSGMRPRVRELLRLLAFHAGAAVHREVIEAVLWPDADRLAANHNLHVAIAALRRALEPAATRGRYRLVRREGDAYRLDLGAGAVVDHQRLEELVVKGRTARVQGDLDLAVEALEEALDLYAGELLPEEGPADWVVERREACRSVAVSGAEALAEIRLARGEIPAAADAALAGLRTDRYHDPLWRVLIKARELGGDRGAANRARADYRRMLAELGVSDSVGPVPA